MVAADTSDEKAQLFGFFNFMRLYADQGRGVRALSVTS